MMKTLESQIEEFKQEFSPYAEYLKKCSEGGIKPNWYGNPFYGKMWVWDDGWDGLLVERCKKLETAGFQVTKFYRKMKICLKAPKDWTRLQILEKVIETVGDEWNAIAFKRGVWIQWGAVSRQWH